MKRFFYLLSSLFILSFAFAGFLSAPVDAACAGFCGDLPDNPTPISLGQLHIVSDADTTYDTGGPGYLYYVYSFTVPERGYLVADLSYPGDNKDVVNIVAYQPDGNFVGRLDYGRLGVAAGDYLLTVRNLTSFRLNFTAHDSYETSPNGNFLYPGDISLDKTYYGAVDSATGYDYFKFELPAAGSITVDFNAAIPEPEDGALAEYLLGVYTYSDANRTARGDEYNDAMRSADETLQACLASASGEDEENACYDAYRAAVPTYSEYYEGADELFAKTDFSAGTISFTTSSLSLPAGTYYLKIKLPFYLDPHTSADYNFRINYASPLVSKAKELNTSSNITLTSLKGTTLSGATISRPEMVQQLMNQGYKKADAIAAVDSLGIDFSYNAVRQALAIRAENPKQTFNDITYGLLKTTYNFNNFQRRKARTILARWVATGEIK